MTAPPHPADFCVSFIEAASDVFTDGSEQTTTHTNPHHSSAIGGSMNAFEVGSNGLFFIIYVGKFKVD